MKIKSSQWLLRSRTGKIHGPLSTREVMFKIKTGELDGSENISSYPGGAWRPISHNSDFYDYLLANLSQINPLDDDETNWDIDPNTLNLENYIEKPPIPEDINKEKVEKSNSLPIKNELKKTNKQSQFRPKRKVKETSTKKSSSKVSQVKSKKKNSKVKSKKSNRNHQKKPFNKSSGLRSFLLILIVLFGLYLFLNPNFKKSTGQLELLIPESKIQMSPEQVKNIANQGMEFFLQDDISGYLEAQKKFVQVLQADPTYEDFYSLLCVAHFNLWPFSDQSEMTSKKVQKFLQMAKQYDSSKLNYANCNSAYLLMKGEVNKANKYIDNIISRYGGSSTPPTIPYYFKVNIFLDRQNYQGAKEQAQLLEQAWPTWQAGPYLAGVSYFYLEEVAASIEKFKVLLNLNSKNKKVLIYIGIMREVFYREYQKAIDSLVGALNIKQRISAPLQAKAYFHLAKSYLQLNKEGRAKKYALKAYEQDPLNVDIENLYISFFGTNGSAVLSDKSYIAKGDQFRKEGDCNAAQAYYKEAIKVNPKNSRAALKSGQCLWQLGLSSDAIEILLKFIQKNSKSPDVAVQLASYYRKLYNFASAQEVLNNSHKSLGGHYKIYREFSQLELARKNPLSAIKYADKALEKYSNDGKALVVKAQAYLLMKKYQEAYSSSIKALELDSTNVHSQVTYAQTYFHIHGVDATIRYLNKLVSLYATEKEYRQALGKIYMLDEQYSMAEKVFKQLIEIDKDYKPAIMGLASCYKKQRRLNLAQRMFFRAASLDASDAEPILEVGLLFLESKSYPRALKQFKRVLNINPEFPKVNYYVGKTYSMMRDYQSAIDWANKAKAKNTRDTDAYLLAGEVYEAQGLYQFCSREYQQALQYRDFGAYVYLQISRCYSKSGALDVALSMLEKARNKESGLPDIYRELGSIYELKGDSAKAVWAYDYYLSLAPTAADAAQVSRKADSLR